MYGVINASGFYSLGKINPGNKIRPGEYKVSVISSSGGGNGTSLVHHVAQKYTNTATSGLTYSVKGKTMFDIVVEKPLLTVDTESSHINRKP